MIKVMIVEDEERISHILRKMIEKVEGFEVCAQTASFAEAMQEYMKYKPSVVFMDIDLNGESGMECARVMVNLDPKLKVIFATAHSEYMANAFEIYAFDYLVKPFNMERVHKTLKRISELYGERSQSVSSASGSMENDKDRIIIKGKDQLIFIDKKDIVLVEKEGSATTIITREESFKTSVSLGDMEAKLTGSFMRSHKSYIINTSMISSVEPYGRWTYVVKFKGIKETALITSAKYEELKTKYI